MYRRTLKPLLSKSFFLFGPRGTGKSALLQKLFSEKKILYLDLLEDDLCRKLDGHSELLTEMVSNNPAAEWVVI